MTKTFADTLGHTITVAEAVAILDGLSFSGPPPTVVRIALLRAHWNEDGSRASTFAEIAEVTGLHITTIQNGHRAILRRLREHIAGQPPTPAANTK